MGNYDSWLSSPYDNVKAGHSGDTNITIERPIPLVGNPDDGWREYEVSVEMDEGSVHNAVVTDEYLEVPNTRITERKPFATVFELFPIVGGEIKLSKAEIENVEVKWSEDEMAREDAAKEDAADMRRECYDD